MIYRIVHVTKYRYAEPVSTSHHELHLSPRPSERQSCRHEELSISPTPATTRQRDDYFGNRCTYLELHEAHRELTVISRCEIELASAAASVPLAIGNPDGGPPWEAVCAGVRQPRSAELVAACELTFESPYVAVTAAVAAYAAPSFPHGRPLLEAVRDLTGRIHADFAYDKHATTVSTSVDEVLQHRRGVCQDFAHLQIACLRAMGLPARYVSGYLVTTPAPGKPRLVGADASHAWISVYCPGAGWASFDPTNDVVPDDKHITIAWGRDFGDVTPMRGVIMGGSRHELNVSVDVSVVGEEGG
jgi:transglutaminase-like putative cysteine protease